MENFSNIEAVKSQGKVLYEQVQETFEEIPAEAMAIIQRFEESNNLDQVAGYNELEVVLSMRSRNAEETLLYALTNGTAYVIEKGNIYIWYKPFQKMNGSGFFRLKRYIFFYGGNMVKYVLDGNDMLPNKE